MDNVIKYFKNKINYNKLEEKTLSIESHGLVDNWPRVPTIPNSGDHVTTL